MKLPVFKLEDYLGQHEFSAPYLLCCSDAQGWSLQEILAMANDQERALWDDLTLGYTEVKGLPALRAMIAQQLYPGLTGENILCFAGAEDGIFCALSTLISPQDHVIVVTPCYQSLLEIPRMKGCEVSTIELRGETEWELDLGAVKAAIRPHTTCMVMNFPHNPTGKTLAPEKLRSLVELLGNYGIYLFSDEVYRGLGVETSWADPVANAYVRGFSLGVMSKTFGMAGLRVGWIASQDTAALKKIERTKHYTSICNSALSEIVSLIALRNKDHIFGRNNRLVAQNIVLVDAFIKRHSNLFAWVRPAGGCTGFVKYLGVGSVEAFCRRVVDECGVLLLPGSVYDVAENYFRIGFGRANMPDALQRLDAWLHVVKGEQK